MSETLSLADAKAHLSELVSRVDQQHVRVTVTVHGRPSAILLSPDDLEAMEETIATLSDDAAVRQLTASDAELARGEGESEQELASAMDRRGRSAADPGAADLRALRAHMRLGKWGLARSLTIWTPDRLQASDQLAHRAHTRPMHGAEEDEEVLLGWRDAARHLFYLVLACVGALLVLWLIFFGFVFEYDTSF